MKYKKILVILCAVLFFLTAITTYLNRVIFPRLIKKIAIERIEETLKRKVEIGNIHFNWVRGFIIDKIKIYEKSPADTVFAQADQVSFGVLIFPGAKHYRITIPFINVRSPSAHLIRTGQDTWNFSDMLVPADGTAPSAVPAKPPAFEIAWGGITISDGKFLVDDVSALRQWSEYFDNINLKLSLSYKGISYDLTADIPRKNGSLGATVYYQPITKNTQAQIRLKNIDTASYLSLIDIPDVHWDSGIIEEINLNINYTQDKTSAQGDVVMTGLDITSHDQTFKGDIQIHGLDAQYQNGDISARGQMALSNILTNVPGLSAGGSVQSKVNDFEMTKEGVSFNGSLHAQDIFVRLKGRAVQAGRIDLDDIKIKKDKGGVQSVGSISTRDLFVQWPDQRLRGDIALNGVTLRMKDENDITLEGELQADHFATGAGDKNINSGHVLLENIRLNIQDQKNISLETKLSLNDVTIGLGKDISVSAAVIKADKLLFRLEDGIINASATLDSSEGKLVLDHHKTIEADPQLELAVQMPLSTPQQLTYKGSITLSDGHISGFSSQSFDNVELDADFQNDEATINALSVNILDTNVRVNGTVKNFKAPVLNIVADADELNLAQIKDLAPQMAAQYGLDFDGTGSVKVKFEGLASDPLAGHILAVASVKGAGVSSSKLHQRIRNITGIIEATPDSLKWRDFTFTYQDQKYAMAGSLKDFKAPKVLVTLEGPDLELNADLAKNNDLITVNALSGKYLNAAFDSKGSITLPAGQGPVFDINSNVSLLLEDIVKKLPARQKKNIGPWAPMGMISMTADLKGTASDWKSYQLSAAITSPAVSLMGYRLTDMKIRIDQDAGKLKNLTFDGKLYDGTVHAVGSLDLTAKSMPYEVALNIDNTDLHKLKMDSPLKMDEIDGKFFLTTIAHGSTADFKENLHATGSMAIRDGYLGQFNLFKGLLSELNAALRLGQVEITDVESNFTIEDQKINTDNLRLKNPGPTIVLLGKGWVNFDQMCDLNVTVDLSSGVVPDIAHDALKSLNIHIYDKLSNPKFKNKISVPQVINTLLKNLMQ